MYFVLFQLSCIIKKYRLPKLIVGIGIVVTNLLPYPEDVCNVLACLLTLAGALGYKLHRRYLLLSWLIPD